MNPAFDTMLSFRSIAFVLLFHVTGWSIAQYTVAPSVAETIDRWYENEAYDSVMIVYESLENRNIVHQDIQLVKKCIDACYKTGRTFPALKLLERVAPFTHRFTKEERYWYFSQAGMFAWESQFLDQSKFYYDKAYELAVDIYGYKSIEVAQSLTYVGRAFTDMGNYVESKRYYEEGKALYAELKGRDSHEYHLAQTRILLLKLQGEMTRWEKIELIDHLKKGVEISQGLDSPVRQSFWLGMYRYTLSEVYSHFGQYDSAYHYHHLARPEPRGTARALKAELLLKTGDLKNALEQINLAVEEMSGFGFENSKRMASMFLIKGSILMEMGELQQAEYQYDSAIVLLSGENTVNTLDLNQVNCHNLWPDQTLYNVLNKRIESLDLRIDLQNEIAVLNEQLVYYRFLVNYVNGCLSRFISQSSKLHWAEKTDNVYQNAIEVALKLYKISDEESYLLEALSLANKRRYRLITERMNHANISESYKIPDSLRLKEISIYGDIDKSMKQRNVEDLREHELSLRSLHKIYRDRFETFWRFKSDILISGDHNFASTVDPETALVQFVTFKDKIVSIFYAQEKSSFQTFDRALLQGLVTDYLVSLREKGNSWEDRSREIYSMLFPSSAEMPNINRLIIVPDGVLSFLPFESLLLSRPDELDKFLIEEYVVHYSLNMLWHNPVRQIDVTSLSAFAPRTDLHYQVDEVMEIANITSGRTWVGEMATVENFKNELNQRDIIHLATHYSYDVKNHLNSHLNFGISEDDQQKLNILDVMKFDFNSDLVVLSACKTGFGEIVEGEGVMSIGRSFSYAGASNLILSLWDVSDQSTKDLMSYFYSFLKSGLPYDQALRQAKIEYLKLADKVTSHPYFWSSFILIGREPNRVAPKDYNVAAVFLFSFLLMTGVFLLFERKWRYRP